MLVAVGCILTPVELNSVLTVVRCCQILHSFYAPVCLIFLIVFFSSILQRMIVYVLQNQS